MTKKTKEKVCRHQEFVVGTIGTCQICHQVRDYKNGKVTVLERGKIRGSLTMVNPPPLNKRSSANTLSE